MVRHLLRHVSPLAGGLMSRVSTQKGGLLMPSFVRPWQNNCGAHRCLVFFNAITERGYEALARLCDPPSVVASTKSAGIASCAAGDASRASSAKRICVRETADAVPVIPSIGQGQRTAGSVEGLGLLRHFGWPNPLALWPTPPVPLGA